MIPACSIFSRLRPVNYQFPVIVVRIDNTRHVQPARLCFKNNGKEIYNRPQQQVKPGVKRRLLKVAVIQTLLYGYVTWTLF